MIEKCYVVGEHIRISKKTYFGGIFNIYQHRDSIPKSEIITAFDTFNNQLNMYQNVQVFSTQDSAEEFARSQAKGETTQNDLQIPPVACVLYTGSSNLCFEEKTLTLNQGVISSNSSMSERAVTISCAQAEMSELKIIWAKAIDEYTNDKYQVIDLSIDHLDSTMEKLNTIDKKVDFLLALFDYYNENKTSDQNKKIGRLKKAIINIAVQCADNKSKSKDDLDDFINFTHATSLDTGKLSSIIDFHRNRNGESYKNTATRENIDSILYPKSSGCKPWG